MPSTFLPLTFNLFGIIVLGTQHNCGMFHIWRDPRKGGRGDQENRRKGHKVWGVTRGEENAESGIPKRQNPRETGKMIEMLCNIFQRVGTCQHPGGSLRFVAGPEGISAQQPGKWVDMFLTSTVVLKAQV